MTAVLYDDGVTAPTAPRPPAQRRPEPIGGDPTVDAAARMLSIPLRHMYALLWRLGVIEVRI